MIEMRFSARRGRALVAGLVLLLAGVAAPAAEKGDVLEDGSVDASDVVHLRQAVQGTRVLTSSEHDAADLAPLANGAVQPDGVVDASDLSLLLRALRGEDVDRDGLGPAGERASGTSLFSGDTDGNGTPDGREDADGDGLDALQEQALGSSDADPSGPGSADPSYVPDVPAPLYPNGDGPTVLFYASRPSEALPRLAPLKALLEADGYQVDDFDEPPVEFFVWEDLTSLVQCFQEDPACEQYVDAMLEADIFVALEPSAGQMTQAEAQNLSFLAHQANIAVLAIAEQAGLASPLLDELGFEVVGEDVEAASPSCPDGLGRCPSGWQTFRASEGTLDPTHSVVGGGGPDEAVEAATAFLGGALMGPSEVFIPDTRHPTVYAPVLQHGAGSVGRDAAGDPVDLGGTGMLVSAEVPGNLCGVALRERFAVADMELLTSLVDGEGRRRGFDSPGGHDNEQLALNLFHRLDGTLAPLRPPLWERKTANLPGCGGGPQQDDPFYQPQVPTPSYPSGTGPRVLVDSSHGNASTVGNRYQGFARLLEADGYVVEDSPLRFDTPGFAAQVSGALGLVIVNPTQAITAAEFQPVVDFVSNGGALLYVIDHAPFNQRVAESAPLLGIEFPTDRGSGVLVRPPDCSPYGPGCGISNILFHREPLNVAEGTVVTGHPVTEGGSAAERVSQVRVFRGSGFKTLPSAPQIGIHETLIGLPPTAEFDDTGESAADLLQGMEIRIGSGRVFVTAEAAMFTAQILGETNLLDENGDPVQVGLGGLGLNSEPGNEQLLLNVIRRLDGLL